MDCRTSHLKMRGGGRERKSQASGRAKPRASGRNEAGMFEGAWHTVANGEGGRRGSRRSWRGGSCRTLSYNGKVSAGFKQGSDLV